MRITSFVASVSWIPSEAITGMMKLPFAIGIAHWDPPPPDVIDDRAPGRRVTHRPGDRLPRVAPRARVRRRLGQVRPDRRRSHGLSDAAEGQASAVHPNHRTDGVDAACADLHADGRVTHEVTGARAFPRHWI